MRLRDAFVLGRVSNLPTVWSNCVAGGMLAGTELPKLVRIGAGASLLYVAGMWLNDAWDVDWDREHCPERPIPAGRAPRRTVFFTGLALLLAGVIVCASWIGLLLAAMILVYQILHKRTVLGVWVMGFCRALLYPLGAMGATAGAGAAMIAVPACVIGGYVVGISLLARSEAGNQHIGKRVGLLLGLMPLVDLAVVHPASPVAWAFFGACAVLALAFQKIIPAT